MTPIRTLPALLLLFLASLLAPAASAAITQDDLLPVDEAFVLTATATGPQASDRCGDLSVSNTGLKTESGSATLAECW